MRINDMRRGLYGLFLIAGVLLGGSDMASAAASTANAAVSDDYAAAEKAIRAGDVADGISSLRAAAQRGGRSAIRAQLHLAKLHSEGKFVPRDEVKACELYRALADSHSQIERTDPAARLVAEAFRAWAFCFMKGAPAAGWEQDLSRAAALFYQAGVLLDDTESLYELAKMYLTGQGIAANPRLAVHFFFSAARRRYPPAQAMLGTLMWEGKVLKRQSVQGLALMKLALEGARPEDKVWIDREHEEALLTATREEEAAAKRLAEDWKRTYRPDPTGSTAPLAVPTPPVTTPAAPPAIAAPQVPPPVRAPGTPAPAPRQLASPPSNVKPTQPVEQNQYNTLPTNLSVPPAASPPEE